MRSLLQVLEERARENPFQPAYVYLEDGEREGEALTYGELDAHARTLAAELQDGGFSGEPVLLLCPDGLDFIIGFLGCLYAGAIAVPVHPPRHRRRFGRLTAIIADARPKAIVSIPEVARLFQQPDENPTRDCRWIFVRERRGRATGVRRDVTEDTPAFLQYTSGSTAIPKGVIVTHGSLMSNQRAIAEVFGHRGASVSWLPMQHDMGLIGSVLHSLFAGTPLYVMTPAAFLQRPVRWLRAISRYGATCNGAPNFAYDLCSRSVSDGEKAGLDLSCWDLAFCGAEPVRADTMQRFSDTFGACGFRAAALTPCYGLAEATLLVTSAKKLSGARIRSFDRTLLERDARSVEREGPRSRALVSCGTPPSAHDLLIVDPGTRVEQVQGGVGEIWVRGPSVAAGYWQRHDDTPHTFEAYTSDGRGPCLRTGDLGFIDSEGALFVTGRLKDLLIIRGRKLHAEDLEHTASSAHAGLATHGAAAFAIEIDGEEHVALALELADRPRPIAPGADSHANGETRTAAAFFDELVAQVTAAVVEHHEVVPAAVCLLSRSMLPRTTSGKVRRSECRARFTSGTLAPIHVWRAPGPMPNDAASDGADVDRRAPRESAGDWLRRIVAARVGLPVDQVDVDVPLAVYGLDSVTAVQVAHEISQASRVSVPVAALLGGTLRDLQQFVDDARASESPATGARPGPSAPGDYALTAGERAMLFTDELGDGAPVSHLARVWRVDPVQIDSEALAAALHVLMVRHAALRTTFPRTAGMPLKRVHDSLPLPFAEITTEDDREALRARVRAMAREPFDLQQEPPWRVRLVRNETEALLLFVFHHVAVDLWSVGILASDLLRIYTRRAEALSAPSTRASNESLDLATIERRRLQTDGPRLQAYWDGVLHGALPMLALPSARPPSASRRFAGATCTTRVSAGTLAFVKRLAGEERTTAYTVLLTCFQVWLAHLTGQRDLLVGTPINRREAVATQAVVGYLVNPVVIRTDLAGNPTVRAVLQRTRAAVLGALAHQDYPFPLLVERRLSDARRTALVDVMFVMQQLPGDAPPALMPTVLNEPQPPVDVGGFTFACEPIDLGVAPFELTMTVGEIAGELAVSLQYDSDRFDADTAAAWLQAYADLVAALPLQLDHPAAAPASGPEPWSLDAVFRSQVRRDPEAIAVSDGDTHVTYSELAARASALAARLREQGAGPEALVALFVDRSVDLIAGMLGILEAGAAYVPIDVRYPAARVRFILEDTGSTIVVADRRSAAALPPTTARVLLVDDVQPFTADRPPAAAPVVVLPDQLAYVIYTSGSTGQPKGVLVSHRNVLRLFAATRERFAFGAGDTWTLFHSPAFDFSVWEVWGALLHGGRLVIVPHEVSRSPEAFHALVSAERVTVLNQTPSAFRGLAAVDAERDPGTLASLRLVIFGGEALEFAMLHGWFERHGDERPAMVNMYGITETTVHVTYRRVHAADAVPGVESLVGGALPHLTMHILDRTGAEVGGGGEGELFVGGEGVARGYWARPDMTAERFVPDPFSTEPGRRLYRSGDRGRRVGDDDVVYLGRGDAQIKIRGHRIEPAEIERSLRTHAAIADAVVIAREPHADRALDAYAVEEHEEEAFTAHRVFLKGRAPVDTHSIASDRYLAAYVVPRAGMDVTIRDLREHLAAALPDVMVPAVFVTMDRLPITAHGKVDRRALPVPRTAGRIATADSVAPRTPVEATLAAIWSDVLGVAPVGVHDNFHELGGDSIRSLQVRALARDRGLAFTLQQMAAQPTIAGLAALLPAGGTTDAATLTEPFSLLDPLDRVRVPADVVDAYPLARIQAGMFYHMEREPDTAIYHDLFSYVLRVPLDEAALRLAVQGCVDRHPILRSSFDFTHFSEPVQLVHARADAWLEVLDWRGRTPESRDAWMSAERNRRADVSAPSQIRFFVHRLTDETFELVLSFYDVIFDGWSTSTVLSEIVATYSAIIAGRPAPVFEPPPVTYRDFVALERAAAADPAVIDFWRGELDRAAIVPLPRWAARPGRPEIAALDVPIDESLSRRLDAAAREIGVPLKHVLLAVHLRVLSTLLGRMAVSTGLESNGRLETVGGERVVGIHINTVLFSQHLQPGTWASLVRQTYENEARLLPFRRYPLFDLHKLGGRRELIDTVFNYTHFHLLRPMLHADGVTILGAWGYEQTNFPLRAELNRNPFTDRTQLDLVVNTAIIGEPQAREIGHAYLAALRAVAADPQARHETTCLLPPARRREVVHEWNATDLPRVPGERLHDLVWAQVRRTPDDVAVVCADRRVTYAELQRQALGLAARLRRHGVGPDCPVGVFMDRSIEMVVALLGVLEAGGAFLPLEPSYPDERLRFMATDAGLRALIVDRSRLDHPIVAAAACPVLLAAPSPEHDPDRDAARGRHAGSRRSEPSGANLAYVLYTSGSTGQPKAVMNTHEAIVNRVRWVEEACGPLRSDDRVLQKTPFGFDVSVPEFFWPLMCGATLVMARPGGHQDPRYLAEVIRDERITTIHFVPSMLRAFLDQDGVEAFCSTLRRIKCSGEVLPTPLAQQALARFDVDLHNLYGPTEAAVDVSWWRCERTQGEGPIPIGRPIANARLYVLDELMNPVSIGTIGELYIGGLPLARGYLHRPDLTAAAFVPDPFDEGGGRLYRTGDLARFRADGAIEFLGRRDGQVKIRGVRTELSEIEAVLAQHPLVSAAVVTVFGGHEHARLVAHVVPSDGASDDRGTLKRWLRDFLRRRLPEPMIPTQFVWLDALPLNASGKVDRRRLAAAAQPEVSDERGPESTGVRTQTEEVLVTLIADCLKLEHVDAEASFFDIGGDSLSATRLASRVRDAFAIDLPLQAVFDAPNATALAARIDTMRGTSHRSALPSVARTEPRPPRVPLSFAQERLYFLARAEPESRAYGNPAVLELTGPLKVDVLRATLTSLVARHEALRTTFVERLGTPEQVVHPPSAVTLPIDDVRHLSEEERWRHVRVEMDRLLAQPFELANGPLLRVHLFTFTEITHVALLALHHIVSDGWSMGVFVNDAVRIYEALARGSAPALRELPVQYADYALWQRTVLTDAVLTPMRQAWAAALRGLPATELPTDRARPDVLTHRGARVKVHVDRATTDRLHAAGRREGATLFMTTLAAFGTLLHAETGDVDLVVGTDVANRTRGETEALIGFFVNQLVLRLDLSGEPAFDELLRRVRRVALDAYDRQELPFEQVVQALNPPRRQNRTPLFQVKFVMQNAPMPPLVADDVRIALVDLHPGTAKFDVLVDVWETADGLTVSFEYREELFDAATMTRLGGSYVALLEAIAREPRAAVSTLAEMVRRRRAQELDRQLSQHRHRQQAALRKLRRAPADVSVLSEQESRDGC